MMGAADGHQEVYDAPCEAYGPETAAVGALNYWWLRSSQFLLSLG